jgi:hypothetical protein
VAINLRMLLRRGLFLSLPIPNGLDYYWKSVVEFLLPGSSPSEIIILDLISPGWVSCLELALKKSGS